VFGLRVDFLERLRRQRLNAKNENNIRYVYYFTIIAKFVTLKIGRRIPLVALDTIRETLIKAGFLSTHTRALHFVVNART